VARRRAQPAPATEPVVWRDGVHVAGTPIWCDARRARDLCFVSAADRVGRAGHGQLIATAATLAQLGAAPGPHLAVPYRRPFTLGTLRLELMPSGHALGAAALLVDRGDRRVLCAGVVAPGGGLGEPGEVRRCDILVVAAPYGTERHIFPPVDEAAAAALDDARSALAAGAPVAWLVSSASKGLDAAARAVAAGLEVSAHRSIHHAARRLAAAGLAVPPLARARPHGLVLWPVRERARLAAALPAARVVLISGLACEPEQVTALGADAAYPWSNAADRGRLLALIAATGAARVYLTGRSAEAVAHALGAPARVLAAPRQLGLFDEARR
jgi:putative mRNA 3-end processing factor